MRDEYKKWLSQQGYGDGTIVAQVHRVGRVEQHYGDLDAHFEKDALDGLIHALTYSTSDQRQGKPNPTKIPFVGNVRNNLASYKSAVLWYRRYREGGGQKVGATDRSSVASTPEPRQRQTPSLSRAPVNQLGAQRTGAKTLVDFQLDGRAALEALIGNSQYLTIAQAVASLTLFSHPQTVRQTAGSALFPSIRNARRVGQIDFHEGRRVLLDDNKSPKDAFLWANGLPRRGPDTQFNHVYAASLDVDAYTALPNICMTPAFIAKLTDTSPEVRDLLRYRSYQLFQWVPAGYEPPSKPENYEVLEWAAPLPPVDDLKTVLNQAMSTKPKDRTVLAARQLGWLFGGGPLHLAEKATPEAPTALSSVG